MEPEIVSKFHSSPANDMNVSPNELVPFCSVCPTTGVLDVFKEEISLLVEELCVKCVLLVRHLPILA